ncbi:ABC transporter permease [Lepagella muris]|uniref:ABC transporter permease n=1 Tax=Lepagella muris TaxID=3032870 RepID=A0AC61RD21_9BACT|nr:ABC transporter permease [Lepagella muris]TGY76081.1 ABC transporter permease [Lepagella muris]THG46632.1 ABC transporter permease [Bacteroidales bacterium]TKC64769.1 ABC transporter permease [Bacteroidales bacterium]
MTDLIREIFQTIRTNKLRTVLTGIAVTWGVFMLIVLLSMARGVTNNFQEMMVSRNTASIRIFSGNTSIPYKGNREGRRIRMKDGDMKILPENNPKYVEEVTSRIYGSGNISTPKAKISESYTGVFPSIKQEQDIRTMKEGRFITDRDLAEKAKVIVLPEYYANQLFPPDGIGACGGRVDCQGLSFKVVGVYQSNWNRSCYIPFTTARMIASDREDLGTLSVALKNVHTEEDGNTAETDIRNTLATVHNFDPADENAVYISNSFTNAIKTRQALVILDTSVWVLGILTLLTGIVGISNIMFVTVRERTHEIGIRRAIGAKPHKILTQVIAEAVGITLLFGYLGIVFGMIVTQIIAYIIGPDGPISNPTVSIAIALEVMGVLVLAGAIAGLFPAMKALKIKPVEALRDE